MLRNGILLFIGWGAIFQKVILEPQIITILVTTKVTCQIPKYQMLSLELRQSYKNIAILHEFLKRK